MVFSAVVVLRGSFPPSLAAQSLVFEESLLVCVVGGGTDVCPLLLDVMDSMCIPRLKSVYHLRIPPTKVPILCQRRYALGAVALGRPGS